MATRMQQRRGTAAQWISTNSGNGPILSPGEIGFESDTNKFKVGDGINHWVNLTYFTDAASITAALNSIIDGAPAALNTLNELAAALGDDANFLASLATQTYVDTAVSNSEFDASLAAGGGIDWNAETEQFDVAATIATTSYVDTTLYAHTSDTTSVHGIADTADLATKTYADNKVTDHNNDTTNVHGIADTSVLATQTDVSDAQTDAESYADSAVSTHSSDTTNIHGITDTADLATKTYADNAVSTHNSDTTLVHGIADTADLATKTYADSAVSTHSSDTTSVHGIADTSALATTTETASAISTAVSDHNSDTTNVHGISDTADLVTIAGTQTLTGKTLESPTLTGTVTLPNNTISQAMMGDDSVGTNEIGGLAVTEEKIAASAVTEGKIADGAVTSAKIADGTIVNADINASAAIAQSKVADLTADLAAKLALAGGTMTGALTLSGAPTSDLHAATKLYVDNVTAGINFHQAVHVATTTNLSADYSNGTGGIGATLTASANAAWPTIDGHSSFTQYDRILVKNQTDAKENGIYILSDLGSAGSKWILTRATDADNNPTGEMKNGDFVLSLNGGQSGYGFVNNSTANPIAIGTDNITYTEFNAAKTIVAGNGLQEATAGVLSIDTTITATKASVDLKAPIAAPTFTGLVTVAASGIAFTDGTQTKEGVASRTPIIQKTASYTLSSLTERDNLIEMASSSAMTLTIPADSTLDFPIGTSLDILQTSTGQVTIAGAGGVTVNSTPGLKLRTTWSSATLFKRAANTWVVYGDLMA